MSGSVSQSANLNLDIGGCRLCIMYEPDYRQKMETELPFMIHSHHCYEVHFCTGQSMRVLVESCEVEIKQGQALIIAPEVLHTAVVGKEKEIAFSYIFEGDCTGVLERMKIKSPCVHIKKTDSLSLLEQIAKEMQEKKAGYREIMGALFTVVMLDLARNADGKPLRQESQKKEPIPPFYLMDYYFPLQRNQKPNKAELAHMLGVSQRQLERIVFSTYHMTFHEKVQQTKFKMAQILLSYYKCKPVDVAAFLGYEYESSFFKAYKKYFGETPSQVSKDDKKEESCRTLILK